MNIESYFKKLKMLNPLEIFLFLTFIIYSLLYKPLLALTYFILLILYSCFSNKTSLPSSYYLKSKHSYASNICSTIRHWLTKVFPALQIWCHWYSRCTQKMEPGKFYKAHTHSRRSQSTGSGYWECLVFEWETCVWECKIASDVVLSWEGIFYHDSDWS